MNKTTKRKWMLAIIAYLILWTVFVTTLIFWAQPSDARLVTPFNEDEVTDKETLSTEFTELIKIHHEAKQPVNQELVADHLGSPHETDRNSAGGENWHYRGYPRTEPLSITFSFTDEELLDQYIFQNEAHETTYFEEVLQEKADEALKIVDPAFTADNEVLAEDIVSLFEKPTAKRMTEVSNTYTYRTRNRMDMIYSDVFVEIEENAESGHLENIVVKNYNNYMDRPEIQENTLNAMLVNEDLTSEEVFEHLGENTYEELRYFIDDYNHYKLFNWYIEELGTNFSMEVASDGTIKNLYLEEAEEQF